MRLALLIAVILSSTLAPRFARASGNAAGPGGGDAAFEAALVAAIGHFAAEGELDHLRAVLGHYPALVDAVQTFPQPHKPLRTDPFTALHYACEAGHVEVVAYLLERGADAKRVSYSGFTPLHLAAAEGHLEIVKLLVKAGADVHARTEGRPEEFHALPGSSDGKPQHLAAVPSLTPLELARQNKHPDVANYLRGAGK
jgi:ankyrin repeat protein